MRFYLSLITTIGLIIALSAIIIRNRNDFFCNKWNVIVVIGLFICIVILAMITILYGVKMFH